MLKLEPDIAFLVLVGSYQNTPNRVIWNVRNKEGLPSVGVVCFRDTPVGGPDVCLLLNAIDRYDCFRDALLDST